MKENGVGGPVPIYQTVVERGSFEAISDHDLLRTIRKHVDEGILSVVVHAGLTLEMLWRNSGV